MTASQIHHRTPDPDVAEQLARWETTTAVIVRRDVATPIFRETVRSLLGFDPTGGEDRG